MTSESKAWQQLKEQYLRQVEKALASVRHPRTRDVLADVGAHLDRRRAELAPDQQTSENLRAIITDMGPPADYAELLEPGTSASAAGSRKMPLGWFAAVGAVLVVGIALILATQLGRPGSEDSLADGSGEVRQLIAELSDPNAPRFVALNRIIRIGAPAVPTLIDEMRTNMNWQIPKALGAIGDGRAVLPLIEKLETSDFSPMREVVGEALERITGQKLGVAAEQWRAWWEGQKATTGGEVVVVYIVTFKPVPPFAPQTSGELLGAFNEQHPPGVRTHHYRTQIADGTLIGHICVDAEAGKDAVVAMLNNSAQLVLIEAVLATPEMLEQLYDRGQPSVSASRSRRASRHARKPASRNQTVEQTGAWPPGTCSIRGYVSRPGRFGRPDNAKVCLSSAAFGSWTVEVEDHGMVGFESLPAGTYRLCIADTPGYKDTYYNPLEQDAAKPTFVLREGERIQSRILMEPRRPYRKVTGRVLAEDGQELPDYTGLVATAWVQRPQGSWKGHFRRLSAAPVQADGTYVLDELDGRPVYVQVRDSRPPVQPHPCPPRFYPGTFSRPQARLVTFGEADVVEGVDIAMADRGGSAIAGLVTEQESGQPVAQALIAIFHHDMFFNLFYTYTDDQGCYRLEGLGEGTFIVHVDAVHKGYIKTRKIVTVEADVAQTRLDFALRPGANISGTFVDEQGQPYRVGRGFGNVSHKRGGFAGRASNFRYGNKYAPKYIRDGTTVFYEEGEGEAQGTMFVFPDETSFLVPAVAPGDVTLRFVPRGRGERVTKMLYQGRDLLKTGLTIEPGQHINDVTIVIQRPSGS